MNKIIAYVNIYSINTICQAILWTNSIIFDTTRRHPNTSACWNYNHGSIHL